MATLSLREIHSIYCELDQPNETVNTHVRPAEISSQRLLIKQALAYERAYLACLEFVDLLITEVEAGIETRRSAPTNARAHRACMYAIQLAEHARRECSRILETVSVPTALKVHDRIAHPGRWRLVAGTQLSDNYAANAKVVCSSAAKIYTNFFPAPSAFVDIDKTVLDTNSPYYISLKRGFTGEALCYNKLSSGTAMIRIRCAFQYYDHTGESNASPEAADAWSYLYLHLDRFLRGHQGTSLSLSTIFSIPMPPTLTTSNARRE